MKHFSESQLNQLLTVAKEHSERDYLMFLLAYNHGLRASEVVGPKGLRASNIQDGHIVVKRLKGSNKTIHPLLLSERELVEQYILGRDRLFPISRVQFWRLVKKYGKLAGIPAFLAHPHAFKHSIAHHTIHRAGVHSVKTYLGHKSLASTGRYLELDDQQASEAVAVALGVGESAHQNEVKFGS